MVTSHRRWEAGIVADLVWGQALRYLREGWFRRLPPLVASNCCCQHQGLALLALRPRESAGQYQDGPWLV